MLNYVVRRLALFVPMAAGMVIVTFSLLLLIPGDPRRRWVRRRRRPISRILRATLGLDLPWYIQLGRYFGDLLHGDMGRSIFQNQPVSEIIMSRLGATIELALAALAVAVVIGVPLGVVAAMRQGSWVDTGAMLLAQLGVSMPVYWLAILLMLAFAVQLGWLPSIGRGEPVVHAVGLALSGQPRISGIPSTSCFPLLPSASTPRRSSAGLCARRWSKFFARILFARPMRKVCGVPAS